MDIQTEKQSKAWHNAPTMQMNQPRGETTVSSTIGVV
jgi:hypothetical protein